MRHNSTAVIKTAKDRWFWQLISAEGVALHTSITVPSKAEAIARRAAHIRAVMKYQPQPVKYQFGADGGWYWELPDGHGGLLFQSDVYNSQNATIDARDAHLKAARFAVYVTKNEDE